MSNKIKKKSVYTKVRLPARVTFLHHVADFGGCGTVRVVNPSLYANQFRDRNLKVESQYTQRFSPHLDTYQGLSFVTFQRAKSPQLLKMITHLKDITEGRLPIIYEIDDNLLDIPKWNFAYDDYQQDKATIKQIIGLCDGVTTSTQYLKNEILKYNKNIRVIPNHLPKYVWGDAICKVKEISKVTILYAGSYNHFNPNGSGGDFDDSFIDYILKTLDVYNWVFIGGIPHELKNIDKITVHEWQTANMYPSFVKSLDVDIMIAPLEDINFNRSKSNIKALESVTMGVPLVCSHVEPYKNIKGTCQTTDDMISLIESLSKSADKRKYLWEDQYNVLKKQLFWEDSGNMYHYVDQHLRLTKRRL